ncbi:uncharacterized protein LOC123892394 [Trifolium pratense]|uniref:uncharacterized protein LOC123892394 n=1 Tax=Trifolium pratense TaxID=57577 RepID=UPI001E69330B|nr:uncharacterized protein LOC123892394 [Trifolium pratense]
MDFTFTANLPPPAEQRLPPEPPDKGGSGNGSNIDKVHEKREMISFRDKVLGKQAVITRERVDLLANKLAKVELVKGNRLMPMLHVEGKVIEELSIPWKDALVIKLLGKKLGYNTMKNKLETTWKLVGGIELMDIGNAFYMVKFDGEDDKNKVINGGPWMIYDHYLAVSQWSPTFNAATATIDKTMVWIRVPSLNLVYYDESLLWALASMVGNPVKVDLHTLRVERGRFARMCVEIDLTKPVVGRVGVNGEWYQVQYEGLHIICTQCGCYGHLLKDCAQTKKKPVTEVAKTANSPATEGTPVTPPQTQIEAKITEDSAWNMVPNREEGDPDFLHGDWIRVERKKRGNKFNASNNSGIPFPTNVQNHSKELNKPVIEHNNGNHVNTSQRSEAGPNQNSKRKFKKKRPRYDTTGTNKISQHVTSKVDVSTSMGVYNGGHNTINAKVTQIPNHIQMEKNASLIKSGIPNVENIHGASTSIAQKHHKDYDIGNGSVKQNISKSTHVDMASATIVGAAQNMSPEEMKSSFGAAEDTSMHLN